MAELEQTAPHLAAVTIFAVPHFASSSQPHAEWLLSPTKPDTHAPPSGDVLELARRGSSRKQDEQQLIVPGSLDLRAQELDQEDTSQRATSQQVFKS